ncbi:MAG: hypothetical protein AAGA30_16775, partial [Planctomycetota bacterium]
EPSQRLLETYQELGPCTSFTCPTPIFGYPEGPSAMYWDCMEFVAQNFNNLSGFCLWLESDMAPVKEDWIDRLSSEWFTGDRPLMMGCYVPDIYKKRIFRRPKLILHAHVNGGACYAMDFANRLPAGAREGVFYMAVFRHADELGRIRKTDQIAFSTLHRVRRDVQNPEKVLLHGFMQPKDDFIDACLKPVTEQEKLAAVWHPFQEKVEQLTRSVRVQFVRRGHRAMLENMLLTKQKAESLQRVAS